MSVVNDLNQTEGLPVDQQTFAASIRGQTPPTLEQKLEWAGHVAPVDLPTQELRDQLSYLRGESANCPAVSPLQDYDDEREGNALACAAAIVLGSGVGFGLVWLFWCLL